MTSWEIAQVNIALPVVPLTEPELAWFTDALDEVNAVADAAPGFRWRLQTEDGDATAVRGFGDDRLIINMSVWESVEALADFVYRDPDHVAVLRRRRDGFHRLGRVHHALWWVPAGHRPRVTEAEERLDLIGRLGPTDRAFDFRRPFASPDDASQAAATDPRWLCPS